MKPKLNSHVLHPQIKQKHANKESETLTNHETSPSTPSQPPKLDPVGVASIKKAFGG